MAIDRRFYNWRDNVTLAAMAETFEISLPEGAPGELKLEGLAPAQRAGVGDLCFLEKVRPGAGAAMPAPGAAVFVRQDAGLSGMMDGVCYIVVDRPRARFAAVSAWLARPLDWPTGEARIDPSARLHPDVKVGVNAVIGAGVCIDAGSVIGTGSVIGPGVAIGRNCNIGALVSIQCALIGDHVSVLSGTRIGEAGFGTIAGAAGAEDMPQFGRVILQDHVSIGANCCVDRGAFDDTVLGERTKVDNLCQIGHNVTIGRNVVMAAFAGLSGTVDIGDGAMLGGRVGIADHVSVGPGAKLAADAAVMRDVPAGETWGGTPAKPFQQWMRETAWLQRQTRSSRGGANK